MIKYGKLILSAAVIAAISAAPHPAHGQAQAQAQAQRGGILPMWVNEGWRASQYPSAQWYVGFAQETVAKGVSENDAIKRVERQAQNRMAEGISVHIAAVSTTGTHSAQTRDARGNINETISREYGQIIEASTNAEIVKAETQSFFDRANNRVYAFAAVKKSDLAAYYTSRIEHYLQVAGNEITQAKQFVEMNRKGSAIERLSAGRKNIAECTKYHHLLGAVDFKGDVVKRLTDRGAAMLRDITVMEESLREASSVFVTGRETLLGQPTQRVISAVQSRLTENKCRVANSAQDAGFVLEVNVNECSMSSSGRFHFCYACVRAEVKDANTGKSDAVISFTGPKESWTEPRRACERAFDKAVEELFKAIRDRTEACK